MKAFLGFMVFLFYIALFAGMIASVWMHSWFAFVGWLFAWMFATLFMAAAMAANR